MGSPPNVNSVILDAWQLRCIFNRSMLLARLACGELRAEPKNKGYLSKRAQDPPGTKSQMFTYYDRNGNEVATVHFFHLNGYPRSEPDPKTISAGNKRYVIDPDNPELRFKSKAWEKGYRCYKRAICCIFGPVAWVPLFDR